MLVGDKDVAHAIGNPQAETGVEERATNGESRTNGRGFRICESMSRVMPPAMNAERMLVVVSVAVVAVVVAFSVVEVALVVWWNSWGRRRLLL